MRQATLRGSNRQVGGAVIALVLLVALLLVAPRVGAQTAAGDGCDPTCVILIQVDGLEPKDLTEGTTPYLWRLAHPRTSGTNIPSPGLSGRSGWIWQAPRGVVSSGVAPATASLLSGGYPEVTGVPANDFYGPGAQPGSITRQRLTAGTFGDTPHPQADSAHPDAAPDVAEPIGELNVQSLLGVAGDRGGAAVFLGDPGLAGLTSAATDGNPFWFPPGNSADSATYQDGQFTGDPRLCPVPRYPDGGAFIPNQQPSPENFNPSHCPANDMATMNKAISDLKKPAHAAVPLTFIHLAELGAAKRLAGDTDVEEPDQAEGDPSSEPIQVPQALSNMDQAVATFVEQYANEKSSKWQRTVLMVVGSNGYQRIPLANRVPNPALPVPTQDVTDYVAGLPGIGKSLAMVPQGTLATVYYRPDGSVTPEDRREALGTVKSKLLNEVNAACAKAQEELGRCIRAVYFTDKNAPDTPEADDTLAEAHPTWRFDALDERGARTGASGDLVVELYPGWATGRAVGLPFQGGLAGQPYTNPAMASSGGPRERAVAALVNGPSGDVPGGVRDLDTYASTQGGGATGVKYFPVSDEPVEVGDPDRPPPIDQTPPCPDVATDPGGVACANDPDKVGDDVDDVKNPGHKAQAETVDFALTISALMQLPFDARPEQLQGRVLQEAFIQELKPPCVSDCEPPGPPFCSDVGEFTMSGQPVTVAFRCEDERGAPMTYRIVTPPGGGTLGPVEGDRVTYTPAAGFSGIDTFTYQAVSQNPKSVDPVSEVATAFITVAAPPVVERRPEFDFYGLLRGLNALVVDAAGEPFVRARRGARMSTIRIAADFGRPETAVTITFYRPSIARGAARRGGRRPRVVRLKSIARFDPFAVKRGQVTMRLKIPPLFKPTHLGIHVREIALTPSGARLRRGGEPCTTLKTRKPVPFRCTGPTQGVIVAIRDAGRLHKRKPGRAPKRRPSKRRIQVAAERR